MIYYALGPNGDFIAGDSVTLVTAYAYPTSPNATEAKCKPLAVAHEMLASELASLHSLRIGQNYDKGNWQRLHDSYADHTAKALIDSILERFSE